MVQLRRLLPVIVLLVGCGRLVKPVDVRVTGISFASRDTAQVEMVVTNPNGFVLDILAAEYQITVGENRCGRGRRDVPIHVGARDSVQADVLLAFDYSSLARSLPLLLQDTVAVSLDGNYSVKTAFGSRRLSFKTERRIAVKDHIRSFLDGLFNGE